LERVLEYLAYDLQEPVTEVKSPREGAMTAVRLALKGHGDKYGAVLERYVGRAIKTVQAMMSSEERERTLTERESVSGRSQRIRQFVEEVSRPVRSCTFLCPGCGKKKPFCICGELEEERNGERNKTKGKKAKPTPVKPREDRKIANVVGNKSHRPPQSPPPPSISNGESINDEAGLSWEPQEQSHESELSGDEAHKGGYWNQLTFHQLAILQDPSCWQDLLCDPVRLC